MPTRNTTTQLLDREGNNRTATHLSTNIIIKVDGNIIGAVQSLSIKESRSLAMIDEVGTDGHIDSAPKASTDISGSCKRVRFDRMRLFESFSRGYIHLKSQRIPFDIEIHDIFHDADTNNAIITVIENVWFDSLSYDYSASDFIIQEDCGWQAESIKSFLNNRNVAQSVANGRAQPIILNQYEQEADRGAYRGALDAAGVLNAFLTDPRV